MPQDEWFTSDIRYDATFGYVMLQLPALNLPKNLNYAGITFESKNELHVSLLTTEKLAQYFKDQKMAKAHLARHIRTFLQQTPVTFRGFLPELYHCKHKHAQTIVVGVELQGIHDLFHSLRQAFSELSNVSDPALHVTLYKYNHQFGIGIQNHEQLHQLCALIPNDQLTEVRQHIV